MSFSEIRLRLAMSLCVAGLCIAGCKRPALLMTESVVRVADPVSMQVDVTGPSVQASAPVFRTRVSGQADAPAIAIVDIDGLLVNQNQTGMMSTGDNPVSSLKEKLAAIRRDRCAQAVVLRINSPGGSVTASDIMRREIMSFRNSTAIPVVACLMDLATSGAYYVATSTDEIIAHPTSVTGGIGVIINLYNLSDVMGTANVYSQSVKSGRYIDMGSLLGEVDPEAKAMLQSMTDEFHQRFRTIVCDSRPTVDARDETNFDGRVFTTQEAQKRGFVDASGYLEDALANAALRAGMSTYSVVMYHRPNDSPHSIYSVTPNVPMSSLVIPASVPGLDRARLPTFLYLWQPDPTLETIGHL